MNMLKRLRKRFKRDEKGQGMVEYGLILALVSVVALVSLGDIGGTVTESFGQSVDAMGGESVDGESVGGESVGGIVKGDPIYSTEEINNLIAQGYIPIATADELDNLRKGEAQTFGKGTDWENTFTSGLNKRYIQVLDINLNDIGNFNPIGSEALRFTGTFDGGGHTINNLTIDRGSEEHVALFGDTIDSTFKNIGLENVNVKGKKYVGGLIGNQERSLVSNSYSTGTVTGTGGMYVGGLVGSNWRGTTVKDSYSTSTVIGGEGDRVGGLVGSNFEALVSNSYATGQVSGKYDIGGLVGFNTGRNMVNGPTSTIENSYATGDVIGEYRVGGLVSHFANRSRVRNSYATGKVTGAGDNVGGLIAFKCSSSTFTNSGWANDVDSETLTNNYGTGMTKAEIDLIINGLIK